MSGKGGKPGDWTCPNCGDNVFAFRDACRSCGTGKDGEVNEAAIEKGGGKGGKPGDWTCPECGDNVFASRSNCRKCGAGKPSGGGGKGKEEMMGMMANMMKGKGSGKDGMMGMMGMMMGMMSKMMSGDTGGSSGDDWGGSSKGGGKVRREGQEIGSAVLAVI